MSRFKKTMIRIGAGAVIFAIAVPGLFSEYINLGLFLAAYLIIGGDVLFRALKNIVRGQIFDENFLMSLATVGAFCIGEYPEGVAVMLFYQVGEMFQSYAVNRSRKSIAALMDIRPDYANVKRNGDVLVISPEEVSVNEIILVKPGEKIPLDGIITEGSSSLDTSALTGESLPKEVSTGDEVLSGCINQNGVLTIQVLKEFGESTVSKILDLVENASNKKAKTENFITKFARVYTPVVVLVAAIIALIPPLLIKDAVFSDWIYRALIFLVVSCPCALVISVPLGFFGGIGGASRAGILIKGSNYIEALANAEVVVFDKTGTLTKGTFEVSKIQAAGMPSGILLELTAHAEHYSNHPISQSLKKAYQSDIDAARISDFEEIPGHGVKAVVDQKTIYAGNIKLMNEIGVPYSPSEAIGTMIHIAVDGKYEGYIIISDEIKEDSAEAISSLKKTHIKKTVMLTGDSKQVGEKVAGELGLDEVYTELLPADKVSMVEELLQNLQEKSSGGKLAFVGDGINDAPVLSRADIGIAMGGLGSDAAIEAADIVIMDDKPSKISTAIALSKKTMRIVKQNIIFSLGVKGIVLAIGALGVANMWEAVFADVGVSVIAILNSARALNSKKL